MYSNLIMSVHEDDFIDLNKLARSQEVHAKKIETAIQNGKRRNLERRTFGFYECKITEMTKLWEVFNSGDTILKEAATEQNETENCPYIVKDRFSAVEERYVDYMAELADGLKATSVPIVPQQTAAENIPQNNQAPVVNVVQHTPLPRINLPTFNGDYNSWRSFHDLFSSVVHTNTNLQPVQKLHYLKGCLSGEAERLLSHIPITNEDYTPAWEKLKERYENKRLLINMQLRKLTNPVHINNESTKGLRMLLDTTEECLQQVQALGVSTENWDTLLIHMLMQGLSATTIKLWEEELKDSQELPTLTQFTKFLQTRARVLESVAIATKEKVPSHQSAKAYHATQTPQKSATCPACNKKHFVARCQTFEKMDLSERFN